MTDRAYILRDLALAAIAAGWKTADILDAAPKLADMILAPAPVIDHRLARDLDRALNEHHSDPAGTSPQAAPAGQAGIASDPPQVAMPAAPIPVRRPLKRAASPVAKEVPHAVAPELPTSLSKDSAGGGGDHGRAVQPRPRTPTGNPPAPPSPYELAAQLREFAAEGLTSRQAAERLGIKPDYCRAFASKHKISFGFGRSGPAPSTQTKAERVAAIEAQKRLKEVPKANECGKRVCRSCKSEFEPRSGSEFSCAKCIERVAGPKPPPRSGGGGKWA